MTRALGFMLVALLALAGGCDKKKEGEPAAAPTGEKAGEPAPTGGAVPTGEKAGGGTEPAAGGDADKKAAEVCKKLEELGTKEGGAGLEIWNELKGDCEKEMGEEISKSGTKFVDCLMKQDKLTVAVDACDPAKL